jgi:tetratricopeptide (TPR) repeat protein
MAERARDLFLAGARAYGELADREQRNTLLYRRKTLREERAKKPASFAIKTDLLDSEAQYKRGKALLEAGKPKDALMLLEFAADCDPQNGVYAAETAWCRFLVSPAHAGRALRELAETLRRDPNCGLAEFYAGEIHRQLGAPDQAEPHLRRAIKLMSPDRRPIDALKALPTERKR